MAASLFSAVRGQYGITSRRWAAITLATGAAGYLGYVGVVRYRRHRVRWSSWTVFTSGVVLGVIAMATGPTLRRWRSPRPQRVLAAVLPMLRANTEVQAAVGSALKPGLFKTYVYSGGLQWSGLRQRLVTFHPYSLQLLFQVHGEVSSAMISLAVRNHTLWGRGLVYDSLVVDFPTGERLVMKGSPDRAVLTGYTATLS